MASTRIGNDSTTPRLRLLGPWRACVHWTGVLLVLLIPFIRPGEIGLLRIDLAQGRLELFGQLLFPDEFYLLLLAALLLTTLFLLATLALGRLWCGWACPQTILSDLVEGVARRLGLRTTAGPMDGTPGRLLLFHGFCLALSLLVAANLAWYFVPPAEFFPRLLRGDPGTVPALSLILVAAVLFIDLAFVRRLLCREFCPYGRFQTALVDSGTLTLRFFREQKKNCLDCGSCVAACPMGIDIRGGYQVECIACGRCLDACRRSLSRQGRPGLIRYTFGDGGRNPAALLNARTLLLASISVGLLIAFFAGTMNREAAGFVMSRSAASPRPLPDGGAAVFFTAQVANRMNRPATFELYAATESGKPMELRGPVARIRLAEHERRRLDFALIAPASNEKSPSALVFYLKEADGRLLGQVRMPPLSH